MRPIHLVLGSLLYLAGCQTTPVPQDDWPAFTRAFDAMDRDGVNTAREAALVRYNSQPDDPARLRLAYVLSRPDVPLRQLERSREILAEIANDSPHVALRDALDREIRALSQLQRMHGRLLEVESRLEALKAIEQDLNQSRRQRENPPP